MRRLDEEYVYDTTTRTSPSLSQTSPVLRFMKFSLFLTRKAKRSAEMRMKEFDACFLLTSSLHFDSFSVRH